jgi:hypothetical protein
MPLWYGFDWARLMLGSVGALSAVHGTLVSKTRSERKGALANATSATVGLIFVTLACGYPDLALLISFGHSAFRMRQIMRAPNTIADANNLRTALGYKPWPRSMPTWLCRITWRLRRIDTDFHMVHLMRRAASLFHLPEPLKLKRWQQWSLTTAGVALASAPFTRHHGHPPGPLHRPLPLPLCRRPLHIPLPRRHPEAQGPCVM